MIKHRIKDILDTLIRDDGLFETTLDGVKLFRASTPIPCTPAVYEPSVVAIVSGTKEAVLDGQRHVYDSGHYLCCPMSMPVEAGTPAASPENPLCGVYIALDPHLMTELLIDMERASPSIAVRPASPTKGVGLAPWDDAFTDALLRMLDLLGSPTDAAVLGPSRMRELHYAVLKGGAGGLAQQAFGPGNAIANSIEHLSTHLDTQVSIEDMASRAGMSRAVFHRKFKEATALSPIQFMKSMRLGKAAMKIAGGMTISAAASDVGYTSPSQFSREFKRLYGQSPRQWSDAQHRPAGIA